jgi:hypothetical protein
MVEDEETETVLYIARNISALHCLPLIGPEQEWDRPTIVPFPNR